MIVATAGHVDHGKTLLMKAITGVDTDRLPEEKSRGMTIDLGFAYWQAGAARIGFIDVPGHERFIKNMLAGVAGIDFVLLVVAADDGVMPQSREHAAIIELLGVRRGAVALTKIDRVPEARIAAAKDEIAALLAGTALGDAPILPVSAVSGAGIAELKEALSVAAAESVAREPHGHFRLAIDRAFTIAGAGIVVTGTVYAGRIAVGDGVRLLRAGRAARVRQIHAQNQAAREGRAGERCALNLAGDLALDDIARGDWVVSPDAAEAVARLDARVSMLASEPRALAHWTPVHVHIGADEVTARVAILEGAEIAPAASAPVQLVLDRPAGAVKGDRIVLRDQSAQRTMGGGAVIDIFPPRRGRARPERLAILRMLEQDDRTALERLLEAAPTGVALDRFAAARNLTQGEADALFATVPMRAVAGKTGFAPAHWQELGKRALETLAEWHRRSPQAAGPGSDRLFPGQKIDRETAAALAAELIAEGAIVRDGTGLRLPTHQPKLSVADAALWRKLDPLIAAGALRPPSIHELAQSVGDDAKAVEGALVRAARLGYVVRASPNRFFRADALRRLGQIAAELAEASPRRIVTAAAFRDRSGVGRNVAIEVLEYFDRIRLTRRVGDAHEMVRTVDEAFGSDS